MPLPSGNVYVGVAGASTVIAGTRSSMRMARGVTSPCSNRSARTRNATAWAFAMASSAVAPKARAPGSSGTTSARNRPSLSRMHSNV